MSTPSLSDDALLEAVALRNQHKTLKDAAAAAGLSWNAFQNRLMRAASRGLDGSIPEPLPLGQQVRGASTLYAKNESGEWEQRVQWVKTTRDAAEQAATMRTVVDALLEEIPRVNPTAGPKQANELLLNQYTVTDLHFGMLAWAEETGDADYDLKIAEKLLVDWFSAAIAMSPNAAVGVLAQLGDLMHHDALESVTPAHKHVLDADSRLQKVIRVVIRVIRQIIGMLLQKHPRVHIVMASANHDPASSAWMREMLHAMYENEPRVSVDNSPDIYYVYEWGKTALFYHHGHKRKLANVDSVFAGKFREIFGRCPKSYGHIGHLHNDEAKDSNLMKVERHRTLAPSDAYASSGGWLSERDAKVITYHREFGEVFRSTLSPEMVQGANDGR